MQKLDMQLQRALNMDDFERAQDIRGRREQIDEVVAQQLVCFCLVPQKHVCLALKIEHACPAIACVARSLSLACTYTVQLVQHPHFHPVTSKHH